jgi:hypothetical protein
MQNRQSMPTLNIDDLPEKGQRHATFDMRTEINGRDRTISLRVYKEGGEMFVDSIGLNGSNTVALTEPLKLRIDSEGKIAMLSPKSENGRLIQDAVESNMLALVGSHERLGAFRVADAGYNCTLPGSPAHTETKVVQSEQGAGAIRT